MSKKYSVFLGDVALDEYYRVSKFPGSADKAVAEMLEPQMGGMIANAACVYASYGIPTKFLGCLNPRDKKLCDHLESLGIDASLVAYDDSLPDSKCMIFLSESEKEHTVFIIQMDVKDLPITQETQDILNHASVIYSGYNNEMLHLRLNDRSSLELVKEWYENGVKLVCDTDVDPIGPEKAAYLPYTHILFMNEVGFEAQKNGRTAEETAAYFLETGLEMLIVTVAEDGCIIYRKDQTLKIPGVPAEVVDVTGAGDTFCSSFTYFYDLSGDVEKAAVFANYAASLAVTKMGARSGAVGIRPVLEYMKQHGMDTAAYESYLNTAKEKE